MMNLLQWIFFPFALQVEVKKELKVCKSKMETQTKQVTEYSQRLEDYDKKFEESSRKFQTLLTVSWIMPAFYDIRTFRLLLTNILLLIMIGAQQMQDRTTVLAIKVHHSLGLAFYMCLVLCTFATKPICRRC